MKRILLFILVVSAVFLLSGCVRFADFLNEEEVEWMKACMDEEQREIASAIDFDEKEFSQKDYCYFFLAKERMDPDICSEIKHTEMKNDCLYSYAVSTGDPKNCDRIQNGALQYNCNALLSVKKLPPDAFE